MAQYRNMAIGTGLLVTGYLSKIACYPLLRDYPAPIVLERKMAKIKPSWIKPMSAVGLNDPDIRLAWCRIFIDGTRTGRDNDFVRASHVMESIIEQAHNRSPLSGDAFVQVAYDYFTCFPNYGMDIESVRNFSKANEHHIRCLFYAYLVTNVHLYSFARCKARDLGHYLRSTMFGN